MHLFLTRLELAHPPTTTHHPNLYTYLHGSTFDCCRETMESMLSEHHMLRTPLLDPGGGLSQLTAEERAVLAARSQLFLRAAAAAAAVSGPYGPLCGIYNAAAAAGGQHLWNQWASMQGPAGLYQQLAAANGGGPNAMAAAAAAAAAAAHQQQQQQHHHHQQQQQQHHHHQQQQQQQHHQNLYQQHQAAAAAAANGFRFSPYLVTPPQLSSVPAAIRSPSPSSPDTACSPDRSPHGGGGGHRTTPH